MTAELPGGARARLALLALTQFVIATDFDVVFVALPEIGRALGFSTHDLQWVISAYTVALGVLLLPGGHAADRVGARRVFVTGLLVFGLASLAGGLATSPAMLVTARAAQGLGAALLTPATLRLIGTGFAEGGPRNRAFAVWGAAGSAGAAVGAAAGGLLTHAFGWAAVLLVNVPVALLAAAVAPSVLPRDHAPREAPRPVSTPLGRSLLGRSLLSRELLAPVLAVLLFMGSVATAYFVITTYLQDVLGYSVLQAGAAFLPLSALSMIGSGRVFPALAARIGVPGTLVVGMAGLGLSLGVLALGVVTGGSYWTLVPGLVWALFAGVAFPAVFRAAGAAVRAEQQGVAGGLVSTAQYVGGALGLAALLAFAGVDHADGVRLAGALRAAGWSAAALALLGAAVVALLSGAGRWRARRPAPGAAAPATGGPDRPRSSAAVPVGQRPGSPRS